jgi:hypothetical protein
MAMYPSPASWRMPYDKDGTIAVRFPSGGLVTELSSSQVASLNSETTSTVVSISNYYLCLIFPNLRDIDGFFWSFGAPGTTNVFYFQVSADTTNGVDGTWTTVTSNNAAGQSGVSPRYRTGVQWNSVLGVKAVRVVREGGQIGTNGDIQALHLYGEGIGARRELCFWHSTLDQRLAPAYLDFEDVPRGTSADRVFRVKNLDSAKTAQNIRVALSVLTDGSPSIAAQHLLSLDGLSFASQVNVGSLAPGAMSAPITMRRVTPSNAPLSVWAPRVFAEPEGWV